jgi:hypothetical protein
MDSDSVLELIDLQASTLFISDVDGRIRYIREPGYQESELEPAPRFFMGRTLKGNIWRFRYDLPADLVRTLEQLCRTEPISVTLAARPNNAAEIRAALNSHDPILKEDRGPAYWIPESVQTPANAVLVSEVNAQLLNKYFPWKLKSSLLTAGPIAVAIADGNAVSICTCARLSRWAAEAGVETVKDFRGLGYASAAVATWAKAVQERGLTPLYSTSWENIASQRVALKLRMVHYGEDWSII